MTTRARRSRGRRAVRVGVLILMALPWTQCLRQDEVECEEAAARLMACCPDFEPTDVQCAFVEGCESDTYPHLSPRESRCILDRECANLRNDDVCERVVQRSRHLRRRSYDWYDAGPGHRDQEVCP
jgi:hypothetical protein